MARKAKHRERYAGGKLRPENSPAQIRAIIDLAKRGAADARLRSEVGRLHLSHVLNSQQAAAAYEFAAIVAAHDRSRGIPRRTPASPSYQGGYGAVLAGRDDEEIAEALLRGYREKTPPEETLRDLGARSDRLRSIQRIQKRYDDAQKALLGAGSVAGRAVTAVAVYDEPIVSGEHQALRDGLNALSVHFFNRG